MKNLSIAILFTLIFAGNISSQPTFNKRLHFDFPAAVLTSIVATDSCYYTVGVIADSIPPYRASNIFGKFDLDGNLQIIKTLRDTTKTFETWKPNLLITPNNNLATLGYSIDSSGKKIWLVKFNTQGDTIFSKYYSDYSDNSWFVDPVDFMVTKDSGFVLLNWITDLEPAIFNSDIALIKTDSLGGLEWHKTYGTTQLDEKPRSIINTADGFLIGAVKDNTFRVNQDFVSRTYLLKVNLEGEIEWEHLSPSGELQDGVNYIIPNSEDSWIILTRKGVEEPVNANTGEILWDNYIFELHQSLNINWGTYFRDSQPARLDLNYLYSIISANDESQYAAVGNIFNYENLTHNGLLVKLSASGDSIWSRYYHFVESTFNRHYLYDIKRTNDGGYIMCGQALDFEQSPQGQQAWLLKVDEYGCLVPGCHLVNSTEEIKNEISLLLYPNPTSDYLNFYFDPSTYKEVQFRIADSAGRIIKTINSDRIATTYIVPIYDYAPGAYFLQVLEHGNLLTTEQFIVVK